MVKMPILLPSPNSVFSYIFNCLADIHLTHSARKDTTIFLQISNDPHGTENNLTALSLGLRQALVRDAPPLLL